MGYLGYLVHTKDPRPISMEEWLEGYKIQKEEPDQEIVLSSVDLALMQETAKRYNLPLVDQYGKPL